MVVAMTATQNKVAGRFKIIEQFLADGMDHMFGNPGTVEQGFLEALESYPEMKYILALQESVAVLMADGYARATQRPTLVQLHSSPGIGNAVGALYQAKRGHAPLVVIGGDAGVRYMNMDAQMAADLVAMMEPVTKYATVVTDSRSLLRTLRRAIKIAATPPMGPVYVCLPMDILDEINNEPVFPTLIPSTRVSPDDSTIAAAVDALLAAQQPIIYIGDGIAYSGAHDALKEVAELLGADVYTVDAGDFNIDYDHPLYQGSTGHMFGNQSLPITKRGDVNLIVGTYMLPEVFPELGDIWNETAKVIHFDLNAYEIAKNHRVDIAAVADPKCTLEKLVTAIKAKYTQANEDAVTSRIINAKNQKLAAFNIARAANDQYQGAHPLHMSQFMRILSEYLPADTVIFDEALTNSPEVTRYYPPHTPGSYYCTRGGSLGVGVPGAIGVKLADPSKIVIGFTGDGGGMYTIQALWSAARHNIGSKIVVCNNGGYHLLQLNISAYWKEREMEGHTFPLSFDLSNPEIRFDLLAQAMGVDAVRVETEAEIEYAVKRMLADDRPFLIDLKLQGNVHPELIGVKCGQ